MKMTIGVMLDSNRAIGGAYFYSSLVLESLRQMENSPGADRLIALHEADEELSRSQVTASMRIECIDPLSMQLKSRLRRTPWFQTPLRWYRRHRGPYQGRPQSADVDQIRERPTQREKLRRLGVEMMLYACQTPKSFEIGIPFIMPIHDLQHRQQQFPEISSESEQNSREYLFRNAARRAVAILADSEVGKEDILAFYGDVIGPDRIEVVPYAPVHRLDPAGREAGIARVIQKYQLPDRFLFYPAQFWPHKNHERIVRAIGQIKESNKTKVNIVFAGTSSGEIRQRNYQKVMNTARALGIDSHVISLGYVPDEDIPFLYAASQGLVMPTFFGPTNIPVLEAWSIGCPVLTSDIRGIREQAGDAALLADPASVEAIADGIKRLWTDETERRRLVANGARRVQEFSPQQFVRRFQRAIDRAKRRVAA